MENEMLELSTDFYCEMFDHLYDNGYTCGKLMFSVVMMGGEL